MTHAVGSDIVRSYLIQGIRPYFLGIRALDEVGNFKRLFVFSLLLKNNTTTVEI